MRTADVHDVAEARVRAAGQRYTRNHRAVVDALDRSDRPLSLPDLLRRRRDLAQSSAYRSIAVLEAAGVVNRVVTGGGFSHVELAQELTEHHHHHRVCADCGSVEDFTLPAGIEAGLDRALARVARSASFEMQSHQLDLLGRCANCRDSDESGRIPR